MISLLNWDDQYHAPIGAYWNKQQDGLVGKNRLTVNGAYWNKQQDGSVGKNRLTVNGAYWNKQQDGLVGKNRLTVKNWNLQKLDWLNKNLSKWNNRQIIFSFKYC